MRRARRSAGAARWWREKGAPELLSEPWTFVVDKDGIVRGSYEAIVGTNELEEAIDAVK